MNFELGLVIRKSGGDTWNSCDRRLRFIFIVNTERCPGIVHVER